MRPSRQETEPLLVVPEIQLAYAAVQQVLAGGPGTPALAYVAGPAGTGKSHLVEQFVAAAVGKHARCVTASVFAAELAEASVEQLLPEFQEQYRKLDLFVCEDVQVLSGRRKSQQQLLAVLDSVLAQNGLVVVTASRLPGRLDGFEPRLISRFRGGVIASIRRPGPDSRRRLLEHFANRGNIPLSDKNLRALVQQIQGSPRELRAAVDQLEAVAQIGGEPIDDSLVQQTVGDSAIGGGLYGLSTVARAVARQFGITVNRLRKRSRERGVVLPRQCAMYLARELTGETCRQVAAYFGCRNHTAVLYACRRMRQRLPEEAALRQQVHAIRAELTGREEPCA